MEQKIRRGVSLSSYQYEFYTREMTLEDCCAEVHYLGCDGVEVLPEQMFPNYPHVTDQFVDTWFSLMAKYSLRPVCLASFNNSSPKGGAFEHDWQVKDALVRDILLAKKLGFYIIRVAANTPARVLRDVVPYAEEQGIRLGFEIHPPLSMKSEWMDERVSLIDELGSSYLGLIPDFGIFAKRPAPVMVESFIRNGADRDILDAAVADWQAGKTREAAVEAARSRGGSDFDAECAGRLFGVNSDDPAWLKTYCKYFIHMHTKFYEVDLDGHETSVDYENAIHALQEAGFTGYLSTEYEGQRHLADACVVESVEQVRRQHWMLKRLLGE